MGSRAMRIASGLGALAAAACSSSSLPEPVITSVTISTAPEFPYSDEVFALVVEGDNFGTGITADAESGEASKIERARLLLVADDGTPVLVEGTYLGPTRIEATLPAGTLSPAVYDVLVKNPDEKSDVEPEAFRVWGPPAEVAWFVPPPSGPVGTDLDVRFQIRDGDGNPTPVRAPLTLGVVVDSPTAQAPQAVTVVNGNEGTITLTDTVAGLVQVGFDPTDLAEAGLTSEGPVNVLFDAAAAAFVRLVPGAELQPADNFFDTLLRIEDEHGNLAVPPVAFEATLNAGAGTCVTGQVEGVAEHAVIIDTTETNRELRVSCPAGDADVSVLITETSNTGLTIVETLVDFDFTTP